MNESSQPISGRNNLASSQVNSRPASHQINTQGLVVSHRNHQIANNQSHQLNLSGIDKQSY